MKTFLKTLIGGALGLGALYVVGKVCYEAGKDVAEVERQLEKQTAKMEPVDKPEETPGADTDGDDVSVSEYWDQIEKAFDDGTENTKPAEKQPFLGKIVNRFRNAKVFLTAKKAFDKSNKSPGILGSLLTNPDGARIEAYVRDGGVQINVKPRAA